MKNKFMFIYTDDVGVSVLTVAGHQPISGASPGLLTPTRFISLKHGEFRGQDKRFVGDWLIQQGLKKIVDVFKGIFS